MSVSDRIGSWRSTCRTAARLSTVLATMAALTGCFFQTAQWSPAESPKRNTVELIKFEHEVPFDVGDAQMSMQERERLGSFLERVRAGYGDDIVVAAIGRIETARDTAIAERRTKAVATVLEAARLKHIVLPPGRGNTEWDGTVRLTVSRYLVSAPDCPDWTKPSGSDWTNQQSSNLGCANVTNLGLMLADPGDLVRSQPMTHGDGQRGALQVQKYRAGKTATATASSTGGGGG